MLTIASIMAFPTIDLSLLRNNNISIDYVNESVDLSKTVIWGIFEGTFSIANANEQFMNFVVHMAKSDKEQKKEKEKEEQSPDIDYTDEAFDEALNNIPENKQDHILNGTKSSRKNTQSGHSWETFFNGKKPKFDDIKIYLKKAFKGKYSEKLFRTKKGTIIKRLYEVNIDGNNVWLYTMENNGKIIIEDAGVKLK